MSSDPRTNSRESPNQTNNHLLQDKNSLQDSRRDPEDSSAVVFKEYDPFATPPDIQKAQKHGIARRVGQVVKKDDGEYEFCEDCGLPTNNEPLPLCSSRLDLAELGAGFPLYYEYVLFCGILLALLFIIVEIYGIIANHKGLICASISCKASSFIEYSLANRGPTANYTALNVLNLVFTILGLALAYYYRRVQGMTADEANRGTITASDYAIMVKKLPETENVQKIKAFFEEKGRWNSKTNVSKVVLSYDIGTYIKLVRKRNKLLIQKVKEEATPEIQTELANVESQIKDFESSDANNTTRKFTGIAFIVFETEKEVAEVLEKFRMTELQYQVHSFFSRFLGCFGYNLEKTYNGVPIEVDRAPEPFDVFWENLGYTWWDIFKKRILTELASLFLIIISFGAILGINFAQNDISKNSTPGSTSITLLSLACSFIITVINNFLGIFVRKLSGFEKHKTYTYYFISVASKLSYAQFVNTAIITLLVQIITKEDEEPLWASVTETMVSKVFFLFVLNAFMPSLTYFADPFYILRRWKRSKAISEGSNSSLNQGEANLLFEGPSVDMAQRYANIQKTMLFTGFYASLVPFGVLLSLIGLFLTYWTDKYILLRRHSRPNALGKQLAEHMSDFLELFFVAFTAGNLIWEKIFLDDTTVINWIAFGIAVFLLILPQQFLASCLLSKDDAVYNNLPYSQAKFGFVTEYDRVNPMTQEDAMKAWFEELSQMDSQQTGKTPESQSETQTNIPNHNAQQRHLPNFFQNLPPQNTYNVLRDYANTNMSLPQMNNFNSNRNFMKNLPYQQHLPSGGNPQFNPNFQAQMANRFHLHGNNPQQRPYFNQMQMQQPMRFNQPQMNAMNHMPGGRYFPQQQQQFQMNPQNAAIKKSVISHLPQNNANQSQNPFASNNNNNNNNQRISSHLPQQNPVIVNPGQQNIMARNQPINMSPERVNPTQPQYVSNNQMGFSQNQPHNIQTSMIPQQQHFPQGNPNQVYPQPQQQFGYNSQNQHLPNQHIPNQHYPNQHLPQQNRW